VRELACPLGSLNDPGRDTLQALRMLFNAGCPEALKTLTNTLRSSPVVPPYRSFDPVRKSMSLTDSGDGFVLSILGRLSMFSDGHQSNDHPDWGPPGFAYETTESVEARKQKREQLAEWLEKKFQEIKQGKSPPLSVGTGYL